MWLGILKALLSLAASVASYIKDKQLLDAGEAIAINKSIGKTLERIQHAQSARSNVDHSGLHDDPNNRD